MRRARGLPLGRDLERDKAVPGDTLEDIEGDGRWQLEQDLQLICHKVLYCMLPRGSCNLRTNDQSPKQLISSELALLCSMI